MKNQGPAQDADVRTRVLMIARQQFAARGLDGSSVHTIAGLAGVTAAMINYYFGGKRALYDEVVAEAQGRLHERLASALATDRSAAHLAGAYFDFLAQDVWTQRVLLREMLDGHTERGPELIRPLRALLVQHFGVDAAALQTAVSMFGAIAGYFIYAPMLGALLGEDPLSPGALERRRRHVVELVRRVREDKT